MNALLAWPLDLKETLSLSISVWWFSLFFFFGPLVLCSILTSPVSTLDLTLLSILLFFLFFFYISVRCAPFAALLCLTLWRQVVNQKANFCCHCSHLGGHCRAWRPWHFKLRGWIKHLTLCAYSCTPSLPLNLWPLFILPALFDLCCLS